MGLASLFACDLELKPYVDPIDAAPIVVIDSGNDGPTDANVANDGSADADASSQGDAAADASSRKRVFVTFGVTTGGGVAGVAGANAKCQLSADNAKLGGTFIAWLSVPADPVLNRLQDVGPWYLVDRTTLVFANKLAITSGPNVPIDRDENGNKASGVPLLAWTGTLSNGQAAVGTNSSCEGFVGAPQGGGVAGDPTKKTSEWTQADAYNPVGCGNSLHLYCIEQ